MRESNKPRVWVIQDPREKNLEAAKRFGQIEVILTGKEDTTKGIQVLTDALTMIREQDSLLLLGNPLYIGIAVHVSMMAIGRIKVLLWDKKHLDYVQQEVEV